jgi:hypothetical protein
MDYKLQNECFIKENQKSILLQCSSLLKKQLIQQKFILSQRKQQLLAQHFSSIHNDYLVSISIVHDIRHVTNTLKEIEILLHKLSSVEEEL